MDLVLISMNRRYMERFDRSIRMSEWQDQIKIHRYETVDSYRSSEIGKRVRHVILLDVTTCGHGELETLQAEAEVRSTVDRLFQLTSEDAARLTDTTIFMFQPVSQIVQHVLSLVTEEARQMRTREVMHSKSERQEATVLSVVSPYGGAGVTTIAYHLARLLATRQSHVLYVSLGLYPEPIITVDHVTYDLSRLLYMLSTRPQEVERDWQRYCGLHQPSGVYSFRLPVHRRDLRDVSSDHINELCRLFGRIGFETIVLDLDAHWLDDMIESKLKSHECWLISPWKRRELTSFPHVREFIWKHEVKYIVNGAYTADGQASDIGDIQLDAILPWVSQPATGEESILTDERIDTILSRLIQESIALKGVGEDG